MLVVFAAVRFQQLLLNIYDILDKASQHSLHWVLEPQYDHDEPVLLFAEQDHVHEADDKFLHMNLVIVFDDAKDVNLFEEIVRNASFFIEFGQTATKQLQVWSLRRKVRFCFFFDLDAKVVLVVDELIDL